MERLVESGLTRQDLVVDYGCGTMRVGAFLIDYLDPGHYIGLDLDQRLLDLGLQGLPVGLAERKRPILRVISHETIASIAALRPSYIFSRGVVQHVPPTELGVFFGNVSLLAHDSTSIAIQVSKLAEMPVRRSTNSWRHSLKSIETAVAAAGLLVRAFDTRNGADGTFILEKGVVTR